MNETQLKRTPVYESHRRLGAKLVPFAGFEMPVQYTSVLEEAKTCRSTGGLFDVSHMGQFSIRGGTALDAIQKLVTNDVSRISVGQAQYNLLCNAQGGTVDDIIVYRRSEDHIFLCVNAANQTKDFAWIREHFQDALLEDHSAGTALFAVQGPRAEALLCDLCPKEIVLNLKYYWAAETTIMHVPCFLSRTGYTGEDGFEIYLRKQNAAQIWELLLDKGSSYGILPCGLGARDTLRIEMGYPLYGHELNDDISPLAAGLQWVVKLDKSASFVGKDKLAKESQIGPKKTLLAFRIDDKRIARQGYKILTEQGLAVGEITSGTFSPHLQAPIALGFVAKDHAHYAKYYVDVRGTTIAGLVTTLPFVQRRHKSSR